MELIIFVFCAFFKIKMNLEERMRGKLIQSLKFIHKIEIHIEGSQCGSSAKVLLTLISNDFNGMSKIARHRLIHDILKDEIAKEMHAITIIAQCPSDIL